MRAMLAWLIWSSGTPSCRALMTPLAPQPPAMLLPAGRAGCLRASEVDAAIGEPLSLRVSSPALLLNHMAE